MLNSFYRAEALKLTVMLVEDDGLIRKMMERQLKVIFGDVISVENGFEAINSYREDRPYLIVTDLYMPKMDGIELIKNIREDDFKTPILVLSSTDDIDELKECINYGVDGFISKPIKNEQLTIMLSKAIKNIVDDKYNKIYKEKIKNYNEELLKKNRELEKLVKLYDLRIKQEKTQLKTDNKKNKKSPEKQDKITELNIEKEHLDDILEIEEDLDGYISMVVLSQKLEKKWMSKITISLNKYKEYLTLYGFSNISENMTLLTKAIKDIDDVTEIDEKSATEYLDSFLYILKRFREDILQKLDTTKNIRFFDDSIIADIKQIIIILNNENIETNIEFF